MAKFSHAVIINLIASLVSIQEVICQCDWNTDGFGYQNVYDNAASNTRWQLVNGAVPGEVSPVAGVDGGNDCYFLATGTRSGHVKAWLLSPCYVNSSSTENIAISYSFFLYHDEGDLGFLSSYWRPGCFQSNDLPNEIENRIGSTILGIQLDGWSEVRREIDRNTIPSDKPFQIVFEAILIGDTNNSIGIDAISVENALGFTLTTMQPSVSTTSSIDSDVPTSTLMSFDMATTSALMPVDMATSGANIGSNETSNVTLNFCNSNLVIEGLDNCTFIGMMFAVIPLGLIFLVWLVCCTYNRYCRRVKHSDGRMRGDADSNVSKDNYVSNTGYDYSYANSMTENTIISPNTPNMTPKKKHGDVQATGSSYELEEVKPHHAHKYEKKVDKHHHMRDVDSKGPVDSEDTGSKPQGDPDERYHVLDNSEKKEDANHLYDGIDPSTTMNENSVVDITSPKSTEEVRYHVLDGQTPPSSPKPVQNNTDETSEMVPTNQLVEPYAEAVVGQHDTNPAMSDVNRPTSDADPGYATVSEARSPESVLDYGYTSIAARTPEITVVDDNGNEDTFM
ncbi:uncharacterized protein [Amphiura filiformis]|uniref:uncharacterized protein n=1 Tax=Amphiura filiformis TaxID=82378 RepID=UPI003B217C14